MSSPTPPLSTRPPSPGTPAWRLRAGTSVRPDGDGAQLLEGASWITCPEPDTADPGCRPAYALRTVFTVDSDWSRAQLAVTAHGLYEARLNGTRVGDRELAPGFTSYHSRLLVQCDEVGALLRPGRNTLELVVSDGWFRGRCGFPRAADCFGRQVAVIARLEAVTAQGAIVVVTDETWQAAPSAITAADLMDGQRTDLRIMGQERWTRAVRATEALTGDRSRLSVDHTPPVRTGRVLPALEVTRLPGGRQVVDFGLNINGRVRLNRLGPAGTITTLSHAEHLAPDGDIDRSTIGARLPDGTVMDGGQVDQVISRGLAGDVFEPRHTQHGFRYVAVDGRSDDITRDDILAIELRSDLRRTGWFECSHPDLNRLHEIAYNTWRANSCSVPTDCPGRERSGFTGDYQIYVRTAAYLEDVSAFSASWLRSVADERYDSGAITSIAPATRPPEFPGGLNPDASAGWGDAVTIVPWELYRAYGDSSILTECLDLMRGWVDYGLACARGHRHPDREGTAVAAHETYLWDSGFHWGEWLEPDSAWDPLGDHGIVATAYLEHSARLTAASARVLGQEALADHYQAEACALRAAWRTEYLRGGRLNRHSQADVVRALRLGLLDPDERPSAAARLARLVHDAGDHLSTGFLSTPWLLPVLADHGYADLAYTVLLQEDEPGWLVMERRGATTVWEAWDGVSESGSAHDSLNHYSKGGVITFLHEYVAGLRCLEPGWSRVLVRPVPGGGLTWASTTHDCPHGRIAVSWELDSDAIIARVILPEGVTARLELPGTDPRELASGTHTVRGPRPGS